MLGTLCVHSMLFLNLVHIKPLGKLALNGDISIFGDDFWIQEAFERFDRPEFNETGYHPRSEWTRKDGRRDHHWHFTHAADALKHPYFLAHPTMKGTVKCSIEHRERGYISEPGDLPFELSYPMVCLRTFDDHVSPTPRRLLAMGTSSRSMVGEYGLNRS